jgi:hypothetical protein
MKVVLPVSAGRSQLRGDHKFARHATKRERGAPGRRSIGLRCWKGAGRCHGWWSGSSVMQYVSFGNGQRRVIAHMGTAADVSQSAWRARLHSLNRKR